MRPFRHKHPKIAGSAYVDPAAVVIGDVTIEHEASIWPMTVVRGDVAEITIGARTNVQDGCVLHVTSPGDAHPHGLALQVGADVTVGHACVLHACTIGDRVLIGMGAIVMDGVIIGSDVILGANSLVPPGKTLEPGYLYMGSPATARRPLRDDERRQLIESAAHYVETKLLYQQSQDIPTQRDPRR